MPPTLKQIVEKSDTRAGQTFDLAVQALVLFSVVSFPLQTLPDLDPATRKFLASSNVIVVALFTIEYALRVAVADRKIGFITSFFGLVDLFAILPFYLATGLDLRSIRALRFLRIFRILKLTRYSLAARRFRDAFKLVREELILVGAAALVMIYVSSVGIYYFENPAQPDKFASVFDGMWWALASLTTVGYGDIYPITAGGRIFTFFVLMIGIGIVAVPTGLLASALTQVRDRETAPIGSGEDRR